ncbi:hypothetical protein COCMIDRAFT_3760 [Bipolaris oryzae ATCC 44560]|uniref:Uncharacterized protein n=1 Tax=Bipolaris oryzae ATCC 44560 TaxID=930090 RepID=W6Z639_COCMI|nr:uncharacterized protein COCMIDRAFT_3760 [Bipolaris oryzae ATCC 44560]EUC47192.1 hypothetical protein COCMIDRAFT_3760 [Bipolaris oryzae ATCC 44560]
MSKRTIVELDLGLQEKLPQATHHHSEIQELLGCILSKPRNISWQEFSQRSAYEKGPYDVHAQVDTFE